MLDKKWDGMEFNSDSHSLWHNSMLTFASRQGANVLLASTGFDPNGNNQRHLQVAGKQG